MKREMAAKFLGAAAILHALGTISNLYSDLYSVLHSALTFMSTGDAFLLAVGLFSSVPRLVAWLLLVASGVGLLLNKHWTLVCIIAFAVLSPLNMMFFLPLIGGLLPPGPILLGGLLVQNISVVSFVLYLRRVRAKSVV